MTKKIKVLVVDDSAVMREMLSEILRSDSAIEVVGTAPDAYVAREKIKALNPDVLTLDVEMPRMDGTALAEHLVRERPNIAVIFVTGYAAKKCGMPHLPPNGFTTIEKPYGPDALLQAARLLLGKMKSMQVTRG